MEKRIVCKFGGSNFKSRESVRAIVEAVELYDQPLILVVSAFYGITNYLTEGIETVQHSESHVEELIGTIKEKKMESIDFSIEEESCRRETYALVDQRLDELKRYLLGVHYIGELPHSVKDKILSYGERLSSLILTKTLEARGFDVEEALPEDLGLITDGEYSSASVDFKESEKRIPRNLGDRRIYVVPGFYGISPEGQITLLGRGGSDYSAAAIARAAGASSLDIWKDVDGYMTANPKIIPQARPVPALSYREAAELSYFGANILHPRTVEPLLDRNIPIRILNIEGDRTRLLPLTIIDDSSPEDNHSARSVTYSDDIAILRITGPGVGIKGGILGRITTGLDDRDINIKSVVTSQTSINVYLSSADLAPSVRALEELNLPTVTRLTPMDSISIIALVGENLLDHPEQAGRIVAPLVRVGIKMPIVSLGASEGTAYFVVSHKDRDRALQIIHRNFFEEQGQSS
ncbi:MAG: aspartate kinase [Spirochaetales bacterium]|nr:aspartate kinase [Spirochaetales bacterium]